MRKSWRKKRKASRRARNRRERDGKKGKVYVVDRLNHGPSLVPVKSIDGPEPIFSLASFWVRCTTLFI